MDLIPAWEKGKLKALEKLSVHQKGLKHKAVSVFVMKGNKVLLQRRALGKYHTPGLWANTCCTHPHWMEHPRDCALRRLEQELGITGLDPQFRDHVEYRADVGNGLIEHELVDIFVADAPDDLRIFLNPDEVMEIDWMSLDQLSGDLKERTDRYTPWLAIYMDQFADRIFGTASAI